MTGWYVNGSTELGFLYSAGRIDVPGSPETAVRGINDAGGVTGFYSTYTTIDVPGSFATFASGINNAGAVIGTYCADAACSQMHAFIATPEVHRPFPRR